MSNVTRDNAPSSVAYRLKVLRERRLQRVAALAAGQAGAAGPSYDAGPVATLVAAAAMVAAQEPTGAIAAAESTPGAPGTRLTATVTANAGHRPHKRPAERVFSGFAGRFF